MDFPKSLDILDAPRTAFKARIEIITLKKQAEKATNRNNLKQERHGHQKPPSSPRMIREDTKKK